MNFPSSILQRSQDASWSTPNPVKTELAEAFSPYYEGIQKMSLHEKIEKAKSTTVTPAMLDFLTDNLSDSLQEQKLGIAIAENDNTLPQTLEKLLTMSPVLRSRAASNKNITDKIANHIIDKIEKGIAEHFDSLISVSESRIRTQFSITRMFWPGSRNRLHDKPNRDFINRIKQRAIEEGSVAAARTLIENKNLSLTVLKEWNRNNLTKHFSDSLNFSREKSKRIKALENQDQ